MFNTKARYGVVAQTLHWAVAALILFLIPLGFYMHELPESSQQEIEQKVFFFSLHKSVGIVLLGLALARIVWAVLNRKPAPLHPERKLETFAAETVHFVLYGAIIALPVSGWLHHAAAEGFAPVWWFASQDLPFVPKSPWLARLFGTLHFFLVQALILSLLLHIGGALKHLLIDRDQTLARMIPGWPIRFKAPLEAPGNNAFPVLVAALVLLVPAGAAFTAMSGQEAVINRNSTGESSTGNWRVRPEESRLAITVQQMGSPVSGSFANWSADITFDPDDLEEANVRAEIDVSSLSLGSVTDRALSQDFLAAGEHSQAVFASSRFSKLEDGRYRMAGELELRGEKAPVTVDFALNIEGETARVEGKAVLNRMEFGVGEGFADEGTVGFEVSVDIDIVVDRQEES